MQTININYAYNGFLYAPLILADELGLFPKNMKIKYRNGDIPAIDSLALKTEPAQNWFAICDPFAKDISSVQSSIGKDNIYIVGTLINKLPIWIYNSHPEIDPVAGELNLVQHKYKIEEIRVYEKYNTGYLIGERLRKILDVSPDKVKEFKFGQEFSPTLNEKQLILTSDVIRIANELDSKKIIFNYPNKCSDLSTYLFTGVLTLKSVIDEHLYAVLTVLAGLKIATDILLSETIGTDILDILKTKYSSDLLKVTTDIKEQENLIRKSIHLLKEEKIYSTIIQTDEAEIGYNIAKAEWEKLLNKTFPSVEICRDPLPSLLLKKNWEEDKTIAKIFADKLKDQSIHPPVKENVSYYISLVGVLLAFIYGLFLTTSNFPLNNVIDQSKLPHLWTNFIAFIIQAFFTFLFIYELFWQKRFDKYKVNLIVVSTMIALEIGIIQLIK